MTLAYKPRWCRFIPLIEVAEDYSSNDLIPTMCAFRQRKSVQYCLKTYRKDTSPKRHLKLDQYLTVNCIKTNHSLRFKNKSIIHISWKNFVTDVDFPFYSKLNILHFTKNSENAFTKSTCIITMIFISVISNQIDILIISPILTCCVCIVQISI
jgi:hypothetical protein